MGVKENGGSGRLSQPPEWRDFIMKRFLSLVLAMLIAITMLIIPASAENYATAVVKGGWLRLRAEASASSETISAYFTGTQVTIIGTSGE